MLQLLGVSRRYGDTVALHPLDLTFPTGQTTVLIGPSGCGKSTLLRLLIGLIPPSTGTIQFDGQPLTPGNLRAIRHRTGYVVQEGGLFPHLTARDNVTLLARHLRRDRDTIESRLRELTEKVHLSPEMLDRYPAQLSGGQRQRVGLMRALMLDPDVLLFDEPLAAVDPLVRAELQTDLKELVQSLHKTTILVTHDLGEAAYLGDTLILMRDGRIVQQGRFRDLVEAPADPFVTRFIQAQRGPDFGERQ